MFFLFPKIKEQQKTSALFKAINNLGLTIYRELAKSETNVFLCPLSLLKSIMLLLSGTSNETAEEIKTFLGSEISSFTEKEICDGFKRLHSSLEKISQRLNLEVSDFLLVKKDLEIKEEFKHRAMDCFQTNIHEIDFEQKSIDESQQPDDERSKALIQKILNLCNTNSFMITVNSFSFSGPWLHQFVLKKTYNHPFRSRGGGQEKAMGTDFMHLIHDFSYAEESTFKALKMPYASEEIAMLILLPNENNRLEEIEEQVCTDFIKDLKTKLQPKKVKVGFPKIHMPIGHAMTTSLSNLGLKRIFHPGDDFSGITDDKDFKVNELYHKGYLMVTEEGSVATLSQIDLKPPTATSDIRYDVEFVTDHPFMYIVYSMKSDLVICVGRIVEYPLKLESKHK